MKNIIRFIAFLTVSAASVACNAEKTGAEKENPGCIDVYFMPGQGGDKALKPKDKTEFEVVAFRSDVRGDIVVPIEVTASENIFYSTALTFTDGERESVFTVSFPEAQMQVPYTCHIAITDPLFALRYGLNETSLDFNIIREDYVPFAAMSYESASFSQGWDVNLEYSPILDTYRIKMPFTLTDEGYDVTFKWVKGEETVTMEKDTFNTGLKEGTDYVMVTYGSTKYNGHMCRFEFEETFTIAGRTMSDYPGKYTITKFY